MRPTSSPTARSTRAVLVAATAAALLLPSPALANDENPVSCSATPAEAFVGDSIAFHAEAPAGTVGTVHWYVSYDDTSYALTDSGVTGQTFDQSHVFTIPTDTFGANVSIGYLDGDGSRNLVPLCNVRYVAAPRPDLAPTARLAGPSTVAPGQSFMLDASGSTDPEGAPLRYAFDLDGVAGYEVEGTSPTTTLSFSQAGEHVVGVAVSDPAGHTSFDALRIDVATGGTAKDPGPEDPKPPVTDVNAGPFTVSVTARKQTLQAALVSGFAFKVISSHQASSIRAQLSVVTSRVVRRRGRKARTVTTKLPVGDLCKDSLLGPGERDFSREPETISKAATAMRTGIRARRSLRLAVDYTVVDGRGQTVRGSAVFVVR